MMKYKIKQEKGITMIALVVTIIMLLVLTNMLIYNAKDSTHIQVLNNLYNDIELLRNKVSEYYNEYGSIPVEIQYTNIDQLEKANILSKNNDIGEFYVIDLEVMQGITLNYGKEYENVKNDKENASNYTDVYIINKNSHNIFYAQGIGIKQNDIIKIYYTDYTEPDETIVDLRYVNEILIPEGYYYVGKEKDIRGNESIVISKSKDKEIDKTSEDQYIWEKQISTIEKLPDTVRLSNEQEENEFIKSVNHYKGYFKNAITKNVIYLSVKEDKWSEVYTKNEKYTDRNGDIAYIPEGFRVSLGEGSSEIRSGLVITDAIDNNGNSIGNEFVWIPVDDFYEFERESFNKDIIAEENFTTIELTEGKYYEPAGDGRGIDEAESKNIQEAQKMYKSVKTYKGFYIGRYETGIEEDVERTTNSGISDTPVVKKNKYIYNYIKWGNDTTSEEEGAVKLAQNFINNKIYKNSVNSTLCYGVQWDAIIRWISKDSSIKYILEDSSTKGNYDINGKLIRSGNYEEYQVKNIYDLAGNVSEWTIESYGNTEKVQRGGKSGSTDNITHREPNGLDFKSELCGFRIAIYIK